jgi:hypothetical protein
VWLDIEAELETRKPFSPLFVLMKSEQSAKLLKPIPQLNLPPNAPQEVVEGVLNELMKQGLEMIEPVDFSVTGAVMESTKHASRNVTRGKILASRSPNMDLQTNVIMCQFGWEIVSLPA